MHTSQDQVITPKTWNRKTPKRYNAGCL